MKHLIKTGLAVGFGHLLGSNFDWTATTVFTLIVIVGLFTVEKIFKYLLKDEEFTL